MIGRRWVVAGGWVVMLLFQCSSALRPLKERPSSWSHQRFLRRDDGDLGYFPDWNITGTYKGTWSFLEKSNRSSRYPVFGKGNGQSVLEIFTSSTKITGVHYVQGFLTFPHTYNNDHDLGVSQIRLEGVYIWPFKQLRMVANSQTDGGLVQGEDYLLPDPYHLVGVFSSQVFQDSAHGKANGMKNSLMLDMEKHCNLEVAAHVSRVSFGHNAGQRYHLEGLMESLSLDDGGDCLSPIVLNVTSVNVEVYYNKAVNFTLMVTFISFLQVLFLIRQMEYSSTQSGAAKVSIVMIGQQAILDSYLCLLHLVVGILVESLFNAFATAAFFKFVIFSIFETRYLLAIWKANRPMNSGEGWETMRRELSVLYSRFYGILLGGILVMYEFHDFLKPILFVLYSFWVPQIVLNVIRDTRKPLHPHYILGMTVTRLAIPLYIFGCPNNFMRIDADKGWCISLGIFMSLQAGMLLLQHRLGSRWFIPHQVLPEKYCYYRRPESDRVHSTDCVICMAAVDMRQWSDCMVFSLSLIPLSFPLSCSYFLHVCLQLGGDYVIDRQASI